MNGDAAAPSARDSIMEPTVVPVAKGRKRGRPRDSRAQADHGRSNGSRVQVGRGRGRGRGRVVQVGLGLGAPVEDVCPELTYEQGSNASVEIEVTPGVAPVPKIEGLAEPIVTRGSTSHPVGCNLISPLFEGVADRSLHILNLIYTHQPQTFAKLTVDSPARLQFLNLLADLMYNWINTKVEDITDVDILDLNKILVMWEGCNFNVTWLRNRLQEIDSQIKLKRQNDRLNVVNNEKDALKEIKNLSKRVQEMKDDRQVDINNSVNTCADVHLNWNQSVIQNLIGDEFN